MEHDVVVVNSFHQTESTSRTNQPLNSTLPWHKMRTSTQSPRLDCVRWTKYGISMLTARALYCHLSHSKISRHTHSHTHTHKLERHESQLREDGDDEKRNVEQKGNLRRTSGLLVVVAMVVDAVATHFLHFICDIFSDFPLAFELSICAHSKQQTFGCFLRSTPALVNYSFLLFSTLCVCAWYVCVCVC